MTAGNFDTERCRSLYREKLEPVLRDYRPLLQLDDRNEFYLQLVSEQNLLTPNNHVVDLGAGLSVFGLVCRAHGMRVTLVDDFGGGGGVELGHQVEETHLLDVFEQEFGVEIIRDNFLTTPLRLPASSVDVVTCFHSLEHWHHSPRRLFQDIVRMLKPGGCLVIATPNAVNLRKRLFVLFGRSNFPTLEEWYEEGDPVFRGHIREPIIRDLHQLMRWNGLQVVATYGRNFIGQESRALAFLPPGFLRRVARFSERGLRAFPSLCSDIHVVGRKP